MNKFNRRRSIGVLNFSALLVWVSAGPLAVEQAHAQEQVCSITTQPGATLNIAKERFAEQCPGQQRRDCDPLGGAWRCSSENIRPGSTVIESQATTPTNSLNEACTASGPSRAEAIQGFASACPFIVREDCDRIGDGRWLCSSENIVNGSVVDVETPETPTSPLTPVDTPMGLFSDNDLLALHYDNCPDRDDGHALAAGKAVVESIGISDILVVNGTCGAEIRDRYQESSPAVATAVWGNAWLNAIDDEENTINTVADGWAATVSNDNDVWVAEGGPSDFTAKVLRRMGEVYPSVDRKRIHVVQHSGWNERMTTNTGLSFVQQVTDYIRIENGNTENNGTADFNTTSEAFVNIALESRYASEWTAAFNYLSPEDKLDFSDTVELLHIVGDTDTLDVSDFAAAYLSLSSVTPGNNTPDNTTPDNNTPDDNSTDNNTPDDNSTDNNTPGDNSTDNNTPDDNSTDNNTPGDNSPMGNNSDLTSLANPEEVSRFLIQASFGGTIEQINDLVGTDASEWIANEINSPPGLSYVDRLDREFEGRNIPNGRYNSDFLWESMIEDNDQLRLRMAFALSQILVASDQGLGAAPYKVAYYMDVLEKNAFGNYRDLLEDITYSPMMARYLTYFRNRKANSNTGREPDENYAREIMQLFSIGLTQLNADGSEKLDSSNNPIPTYNNDDIVGLSRVFTGLSHDQNSFSGPVFNNTADRKRMKMFDQHHSVKEKSFLGESIQPGTSGDESIRIALNTLFNHPNVGPFISRQLIQRFTSSSPKADYVERVSAAFDAGSYVSNTGRTFGTGERGDLAATIAAILLDESAHSESALFNDEAGKTREPVLRLVHLLRAFNASPVDVLNNEDQLRNTSSSLSKLAQHPYRPPSVFNFYRPGFVAANTESGDAGLTTPELQIINDGSVLGITNFLTDYAVDRTGDTGNNASLVPNYNAEIRLADDAEELVSHLDVLLTAGSLGNFNKQRIVEIVESIEIQNSSRSSDLLARVHAAVFATIASSASATLQ